MAEASTIGAAFDRYTGDVNLGGGSLGYGRVDTRPIEDFAKYTMLYNKAEWDQRQRDAEKAAEELANFAALDLTTMVPGEAKKLQDKYDELYQFARSNPDALNYKNRDKWLEYKKKKADLLNDISFSKQNSILYQARKEDIANSPEAIREEKQRRLDEELAARKNFSDIIGFAPKDDLTLPDWGQKGPPQSISVLRRGANEISNLEHTIFDRPEANRVASAYAGGFRGIDEATGEGRQKLALLKSKPLVRGTDLFNQALASAQAQIDKTKSPEEQRAQLMKILSSNGITGGMMKLADAFNAEMKNTRDDIRAKRYTDEFGSRLKEEDYQDIDIFDPQGISPEEMSLLAQFSAWPGNEMRMKQTQTDNALQAARIALGYDELGLQREKLDKMSDDAKIGADSVLRTVSDLVNNAKPFVVETGNKKAGFKKGDELRKINDPDLLREFSTIDKDGNVTSPPDEVFLNPKNNTLTLMYYEKEGGNYVLNSKGNPVIARDNVILDPVEWMNKITRRRYPNKDIGDINTIIDMVYSAYDRNVSILAKEYKGGAATMRKGEEVESKSTTTKAQPNRWSQYEEK